MDHPTYRRHRRLLERDPDQGHGGYAHGYSRGLRVAVYDIPLPDEHSDLLRRPDYKAGFRDAIGGKPPRAP